MRKLIVASLVCLLAAGCVCPFKGATDSDQISKLLKEWRATVMTRNLDALIALYSESYQTEEIPDKASLHMFLKEFFDNGQLDNAKVDLAIAQVEIHGSTADVADMKLTAQFGGATIGFHLVKEDKAWKIDAMHTTPY